MSLENLVEKVRDLVCSNNDPNVHILELNSCARQALIEEFQVEPTAEEVEELANEVEASVETQADFLAGWSVEDDSTSDRQPTDGKRVIRKSAPLAG